MDAVRPADLKGVAVLVGPCDDRVERAADLLEYEGTGSWRGERERRVDDVRGCEAVVEPAAVVAECVCHGVDERGDVVARLLFDLRDAVGRRGDRVRADARGRVGGDSAELRP